MNPATRPDPFQRRGDRVPGDLPRRLGYKVSRIKFGDIPKPWEILTRPYSKNFLLEQE